MQELSAEHALPITDGHLDQAARAAPAWLGRGALAGAGARVRAARVLRADLVRSRCAVGHHGNGRATRRRARAGEIDDLHFIALENRIIVMVKLSKM